MSEKISNLYVARIFAEHPLALWALDDNFDYISKLSVSDKKLVNWNLENLEEVPAPIPENLPLFDEFSAIFTIVNASAGLFGSASASAINSFEDLDPDKKTISINAFVYDFEGFIDSYEIGFVINNVLSITSFTKNNFKTWEKISHTANIPEESVDIYPYIKINYSNPQVNSGNEFNFAINSISVGQWSELFHYENTGVIGEEIQNQEILNILENLTTLDVSEIKAVSADSYGIEDPLNGYYLIEKNRMLSINNRLPMTFGATNITNVRHPISGKLPSLIFPGMGFLNELGRYGEFTAEFWLRCYTDSKVPLKIFGPLTSGDGIYIEKDFITLKIGQYRQSYFVGKWYRPMLIDFRYSSEDASLLINGDLVIQLSLDQSKILFPLENENYVGFFAEENIYPFDIDAFAIYPYKVQEQIAKKRYVYAKGVDSADNIASNFKGDSFNTDFPFMRYTSNLNYPDMNAWNSGFFLNTDANSRFLTLPDYEEPQIILDSDIDLDNFLFDNYNIQSSDYPFIKLKPDSKYNNINSSIYFKTLNVLNEPVKSFFSIFRSPESWGEEKENLVFFTNNFNNNTFSINLNEGEIEYVYNGTKIHSDFVEENAIFTVGFDLDLISIEYREIIGNFFSNPQNISFSIGLIGQTVFSGKIYKINFNDRFYTNKDLSEYILENGIFKSTSDFDNLIDYIGNYTYYPQVLSDSLILDIGSSGYWEDSIPFSYFGKLVNDRLGKKYYDLDLIQFNLEIPSSPIFKTDRYRILDGGFYNTFNYELYFTSGFPTTESFIFNFDGGEPSTEEFVEFLTDDEVALAFGNFATPEYTVKSYMTIQEKNEVGKIPYSQYSSTQRIGANRVLDFDNVFNFRSTKYEIVDNTVIFPPKEQVSFKDYYVTIHIELKTKGIKKNPLKIKKMSLVSLAYDESSFYSVSSPTGYKAYPFSRSGNTYVFKKNNPFVFYKETSSYMYKTLDSGFSVLPYESNELVRGVTIPINQQLASEYLLGAVQFWGFYNKDKRIEETTKIGIIKGQDRSYDIYIEPEDGGLRGQVVVYDSETNKISQGIKFYQNGNLVSNIYIRPLLWNSFVFAFDESLVLNSRVGQLEIYEGLMVNNIAFYKKSTDILGTTLVDKLWQEVRTESSWGTWLEINPRTNNTYVWENVDDKLIIETFTIDGKSIYETTFGLATAISKDSTKLVLESDGVKIVTGSIWDQFADRPV
jgi:hypothetical protein